WRPTLFALQNRGICEKIKVRLRIRVLGLSPMVRIWGLAALAAGIWLLSVYGQSMPRVLPPDAPATVFSESRADAALARVLGPERPHPAGSPEAATVRGRILKELAAIGVPARQDSAMSCVSEARWHQVNCATITNIIAD